MRIDCVLAYPIPTKDSPTKGPALPIFYPGAMLEMHGLNVAYFDERFDDFSKFISLMEQNPLCVGVSSMTGYQLIGSKRMFEVAKKISPNIYTIFGGAHPSILPIECVAEDFVDVVVVGEGEETLLEIVTKLKDGKSLNEVHGIALKKNGKAVLNPRRKFMDPRTWPFPMTEKNKPYFKAAADRDELMLPASRGCPFDCSFCHNQLFNQRRWRSMPADKFKDELEIFMKEFTFSNIYINDDEIGFTEKRVKEIAGVIRPLGLTWSTSIRCCDVTNNVAKILDESGCHELLLGVESGSDRVLNEILTKGYPKGIEDVRECARALSKTNICGRYNFMAGVPTESKEDVRMSIDLVDWIDKIHHNAIFNFDAYAPYPGTKLYKMALEIGFQEPKTIEEWSEMTLSNPLVPVAQNLYYICGLRFRGKSGDVTSRNFPGIKRLLILPFEILAHIRWRIKFLSYYKLEKAIIKMLFSWASKKAQ